MCRLNHVCLGTQHKASGTYDDVHDYFGEAFTQTIVSSVLAQGSTVINVYTPYGGTNWGTIGTSRWCGRTTCTWQQQLTVGAVLYIAAHIV